MTGSGETARSLRLTPAALRLVLDATDGVYNVVDRRRIDMTPRRCRSCGRLLSRVIVTSIREERELPSRPNDWKKIINADAEVCHWVAPDGTRHPCTDEENAEVRRELLMMRTTSDKRRQQQIEER